MQYFSLILLCGLVSYSARAAPVTGTSPSGRGIVPRDGPTSDAATSQLSAAQQSSLVRPAQFSRVAYCSSAAVTSWSCGPPCDDIGKGVEVIQAGGDDGLVPMYFVAHDPIAESIVVAHQGTDPDNILSIINDAQILLKDLNSTRFPSAGDSVKVHDGFQKTFERTADGVLSGVQRGLAANNVNKVVVTGHSLGAAIAVMDAMMLKEILGSSVEITTTVFGLPRGGNEEWANFVDQTLGSSLTHVTNQDDPVPILPPRLIGYQHPQGEIHINAVDGNGDATDIVACPGQENENCSEGNNILFDHSVANHAGPYIDNISFGGDACPL
ncbi:hypothetical protein PC9H_006847 [Pleurotus ostreatus]|uniref:Fungal lipase-type domain-containing protein n=1 Tax=Pleurotus ostreatus TaxID=5322 RepID=A0A8H6ZYP7_PLEOS|nr:uncharacterized protein PC9H_006847 [Pleurotus ostreatus]KAF7431127.1 hypothetical protein PC9H_006847 [Pleurotus ostreatus]